MKRSLFLYAIIFAAAALAHSAEISLQDSISQIGNEENERTKISLLLELKDRSDLSKQQRQDLSNLIAEIERWNDSPRLDYFSNPIRKNLDWDFKQSENSIFQPLTDFYFARMLVWCALEYGEVWNRAEVFKQYMDKARALLEKSRTAFPDNRLIRMYLGEPISQPEFESPHDAPKWAVYQREALQHLADIVVWWIENRMRDNGEYGGGWGDDCEMWRWWVPALIAFDDPQIVEAQTFFSNALLNQPHMKGGYTSHLSDVEHTAEDSADAITPMMHLAPDDPVWKKRALRLAELMKHLWTGKNERGFLQFKSTYFTSEKVDLREDRACDSVYHPRAVQPALLYWQRTGDANLTRLFTSWMDTWVDATARSERGKPAGIVPSALHWPSGSIGGVGENWWDPKNYGESLYRWPSAMGMMLNSLLQTYHMTGDETYLQPIRSMAKIRIEYLQNNPKEQPEPGSIEWCASRIDLSDVLAKYRFLTGRSDFDALLEKERNPYFQYRMFENESTLTKALRQNAEALRVNFPGYTSEVRYTDRCMRFPAFLNRSGWTEHNFPSPNPSLLYATATGDPGDALYFPLNRVRWLTPPRDIAALVTNAGPDRFTAQLYHFGKNQRSMGAELYLLAKGNYQYTIESNKIILLSKTVSIQSPRIRISFAIPPRAACELNVRKVE